MIDAALKRDLDREFVSRTPTHPLKLAEYLEADLPDPARWRWCMVAVVDVGCAAISNGVAWVRPDGSAV